MGSGKSSVGKALSILLNRKFVDLDEHILLSTGAPSINSLFSYLGDSEFRLLERKSLEEVLKNKNQIIATGGGTLVSQTTHKQELGDAIVVYLETDFEVCKQRASRNDKRPLFKDVVKAEELFTIRKPLYEDLSQITVRSDGASAKAVAHDILRQLKFDD